MGTYKLIERKPTVEEYIMLRESVGWGFPDSMSIKKGLANSQYAICVSAGAEVIGTARVVGDGSTCFYVQDVIVKPQYQHSGIGLAIMGKIMAYITQNACYGAIVGLMAAKGKEPFYEKFGFWKRPNETYGHGMIQFWGVQS